MTAADDELRATLQRLLAREVISLARRASEYSTSAALEELDVVVTGGERLALMFKDVSAGGLAPGARAAKPAFLRDPLREITVYRDVLHEAGVGTPHFYGADETRGWLFIERVSGVELFQVGPRATWEYVAAHLAEMHDRVSPGAAARACAIRHDAAFYLRWPSRAVAAARARADDEALAVLEPIAHRYDDVVARLTALPVALIHGEFYASNVLVDQPEGPSRVAAVDWEMTGLGPGLIDLAALTAGNWSDADRAAITGAYLTASSTLLAGPGTDEALAACRLHLALQWLGWSATWVAPPEHRQDWLSEARSAARTLGLAA